VDGRTVRTISLFLSLSLSLGQERRREMEVNGGLVHGLI
jgi:hypothetical protein